MAHLTDEERTTLLRLARGAILRALEPRGSLPGLADGLNVTPALEQPVGVFVSLKLPPGPGETRAKLRGCIGSIEARAPLYRGVIDVAPKAALEDPRFPPLTPDELRAIWIEISVLTPLRPLARLDDLEPGRDGVDLRRGPAHAVFLPQVATDMSWTREELLRQLALKAGLDEGGWRGADLCVFRAESFREA